MKLPERLFRRMKKKRRPGEEYYREAGSDNRRRYLTVQLIPYEEQSEAP